jgi:hypothetical protein
MGYNQLIKDYYGNLNNLVDLLKKLTESYRLLIGGAYELNNIPEARTKYVKEAVSRADKLGEEIDHLIDLLDECGESYYKYVIVMNDYILKNGNNKVILTEVDSDLQFGNSPSVTNQSSFNKTDGSSNISRPKKETNDNN